MDSQPYLIISVLGTLGNAGACTNQPEWTLYLHLSYIAGKGEGLRSKVTAGVRPSAGAAQPKV